MRAETIQGRNVLCQMGAICPRRDYAVGEIHGYLHGVVLFCTALRNQRQRLNKIRVKLS